jgi:tryptophanase
MAGRDMDALAKGLYEAIEFSYLQSRVSQVARLGSKLEGSGVPVLKPFGGHAIFIDALKFLPQISREEFPAQTLATELYLEGGIRSVEIGTLMADRDPITRQNRFPALEMVRLAIPRRVYTDNHMDYVTAVVNNVYERRSCIRKGLKILWEADIMRHFTVKLGKIS